MKKIKVSIIIPIYNVEPYILECLQSVANQTMTEGVECILVDDCGTDNSVKTAIDFLNKYQGPIEFSFAHHLQNQGLSCSRNTGINSAKGEYLYFLDSDDYITPKCIESLWTLVQCYHPDLVIGSYFPTTPLIKRLNEIYHPENYSNCEEIKRSLLNYDILSVMAQNRLVKRSIICKYNLFFKPGIIHEDNYWTYFLAKHVRTMSYCAEPIYYYRQTPGSITHSKDKEKETKAFTTMLRDFCAHIDSFERNAQLRYIFCHLLTAIDCGYYHDKMEKESLLKTFYSSNKFFMRPLVKKIFDMNPQSEKRGKIIRWVIRIYEHLK